MKLECDEPLKIFAFKFNLRRYNAAHYGCLRIIELVPAAASDSDEEESEAEAYTRPPFGST